ncbi:(Na+)-NQR maturation NqrM [Halopseudomonas nanhaiensis]|uniref:(Na+)-NQR maturation NqrM n=1 Tax=Halopseudomonas nanhaiensis TaxID=2830842 RepID=UPI001CBC76B8|nr:(Na+)-NQR maturation NqrM [Halopseudomonas nanhaiensis]UAW98661.1 (Na+)-NQR maturation NqrM [Halopseudomonas nanhaiensis]
MVWLLAFLLMALVVAGMAVGVMMGRKPIAGSCGGIGMLGIEKSCSICGGNPSKCQENSDDSEQDEGGRRDLAYDATMVD